MAVVRKLPMCVVRKCCWGKVDAWSSLPPFVKDQQKGRSKSLIASHFSPHDKNLPVLPIKPGETTGGQHWFLRGEARLSQPAKAGELSREQH